MRVAGVGLDLGRWGGGNSTLQVGPRAGWLGEGASQFRLCACMCVCVCCLVCFSFQNRSINTRLKTVSE